MLFYANFFDGTVGKRRQPQSLRVKNIEVNPHEEKEERQLDERPERH